MAILMISRQIVLAGALLMSAALTLPPGVQAATTAPAPKAPSVSTSPSPSTNAASVTFKGTVNPHGLATVYAFQFGATTGYGAQTAPTSVGNGTTTINVSQTMKGLQPGAIYHYRLVAENGAGTTNGQDVAFTIKMPLKFKITRTPDPVVFGSPFTLSGVLTGTGDANRDIMLQANPFPFLGGFKTAAGPVLTDATGSFSFAVANLMQTTQFRVATVVAPGAPAVMSSATIERVAVRVSLRLRSTKRPGFVRVYGTVAPPKSVQGSDSSWCVRDRDR